MLMGDLYRVDDELEVMARLLDELRQPAQMLGPVALASHARPVRGAS